MPRRRSLRSWVEPLAVAAGTLLALWMLWCAATERFVGASGASETRYGLLGWRLAEGSPRPFLLRIVPWIAPDRGEVRPIAAAATAAASAAVIAYASLVVARLERNRRPRGVCVRCGHRTREGSRRLTVCPECGALPNARPSAFVPYAWGVGWSAPERDNPRAGRGRTTGADIPRRRPPLGGMPDA